MALEPRRRKQPQKQEGAYLVGTGPSFSFQNSGVSRFPVSVSFGAVL